MDLKDIKHNFLRLVTYTVQTLRVLNEDIVGLLLFLSPLGHILLCIVSGTFINSQ